MIRPKKKVVFQSLAKTIRMFVRFTLSFFLFFFSNWPDAMPIPWDQTSKKLMGNI